MVLRMQFGISNERQMNKLNKKNLNASDDKIVIAIVDRDIKD